MSIHQKFFAAGASMALALALSAPASAAVIIKPVSTGVFNLANFYWLVSRSGVS